MATVARLTVVDVGQVEFEKRQVGPSRLLVVAFVSAVGLALTLAGALHAPTSSAVSVIGDEEAERFVGSGAVLLPTSVGWSDRVHASTCVGCRWKVTAPCLRDDEHGDAGCRGAILGCPQGREIGRAWLARPGQDFVPVGLFCPSDGEVTSVADATERVSGQFVRNIPPLSVKCAPEQRAVVGIPLHCRSLQPSAQVSWVDSIAGYSVHTSAVATWHWNFQQFLPSGATAGEWSHVAVQPGGDYPGLGVRQGFTVAGVHLIDVRAHWRGTFTVDGLGPFAINPGLDQRARVQVPTGSALGIIRRPAVGRGG